MNKKDFILEKKYITNLHLTNLEGIESRIQMFQILDPQEPTKKWKIHYLAVILVVASVSIVALGAAISIVVIQHKVRRYSCTLFRYS